MKDRPTTRMKKGWLCINSYDEKNEEIAPFDWDIRSSNDDDDSSDDPDLMMIQWQYRSSDDPDLMMDLDLMMIQ